MFSKSKFKRAISRMALIAVVVVIIIIVAVGSYAAVVSSTKASTVVSTVTTTSVLTTVSTQSATSTGSATASSSSSTSSSSLSSISPVSTVPFSLCVNQPTASPGVAVSVVVQNLSLLTKYDPKAYLNPSSTTSSVIAEGMETGLCQMAVFSETTLVPDVVGDVVNLTEVAVVQGEQLYSVAVGANTTYTSVSQLQSATWVQTSFTQLNEEILFAQEGWAASSIKTVSSSSAAGSLSAVIAGQAVDYSSYGGVVIPFLAHEVKILYNSTTAWPSNVLVTTPAFAKANPTAVQAAVDAYLYASNLMNTPADSSLLDGIMLSAFNTYTLSQVQAELSPAVQSVPTNGLAISIGQLQTLINTDLQYNLITKNASATSMVTPGYVTVGP